METAAMEKLGELLLRKSVIMELINYVDKRAMGGDIKEIRDFAPNASLSELIIKEREE